MQKSQELIRVKKMTSDSDILQMDGIAIPIDAAFAISLP
jgi:hypothetical protein